MSALVTMMDVDVKNLLTHHPPPFTVSSAGSQEQVLQPQSDSRERPGEFRLPQHL